MGCDIHLYIEYKLPSWEDDRWASLGGGNWHPGRDYSMFSIMANVRAYVKNGEGLTFFKPRGRPEGMGYLSSMDDRLYISKERPEDDGNTSPERAERWIKQNPELKCEDPRWVYHPDWHSHSHLTAEEFDQVMVEYVKRYTAEPGIGYKVIQSSLKTLVDNGYMARLVFWFDN